MYIEEVWQVGDFDNIKPCPCCGGKADIIFGYTYNNDYDSVFIKCESGSCGLQTETAYTEIESAPNVKNALIREVIARWNRRAK